MEVEEAAKLKGLEQAEKYGERERKSHGRHRFEVNQIAIVENNGKDVRQCGGDRNGFDFVWVVVELLGARGDQCLHLVKMKSSSYEDCSTSGSRARGKMLISLIQDIVVDVINSIWSSTLIFDPTPYYTQLPIWSRSLQLIV